MLADEVEARLTAWLAELGVRGAAVAVESDDDVRVQVAEEAVRRLGHDGAATVTHETVTGPGEVQGSVSRGGDVTVALVTDDPDVIGGMAFVSGKLQPSARSPQPPPPRRLTAEEFETLLARGQAESFVAMGVLGAGDEPTAPYEPTVSHTLTAHFGDRHLVAVLHIRASG